MKCCKPPPALPLHPAHQLNDAWLLPAGDGSYGQLGNGQGNYTRGSFYSSVPVQVLGDKSFSQVCTADRHSCALEPSGKAWCWGAKGRLGSSQADSSVPVEVAGGHTFQSIACGQSHTCAIDIESRAWCWGV